MKDEDWEAIRDTIKSSNEKDRAKKNSIDFNIRKRI